MKAEIKPGDVVLLKSGGPAMTVTAVEDQYGTLTAWCMWFEKTQHHTGVFPIITIEKTELNHQ